MKKELFTRLLSGLAVLTLIGGIAGCGDPDEVVIKTDTELCIEAIESGETPKIEKACIKDSVDGMPKMVAHVQLLMDDLSGLISIVASQLAPGYQPQQSFLDVGSIAESALDDIVKRLKQIETLSVALRSETWDDLILDISSAELKLDISDLLTQIGDDEEIPDNLAINLRGEWNRVEVLALGSVASTLIGAVDFLLAHKIKIDLDSLNNAALQTSWVAGLIAANPDLLIMNDSDRFVAAADSFIKALDLASGEDNGAPGSLGLIATLDEQIANDADQTNNLIAIIDNGDGTFGKGDKLKIQAIADAIKDMKLKNPPENPGEIENTGVSRATMDAIVSFGRATKNDLNKTTTEPYSVQKYIKIAWEDIDAAIEDSDLSQDVPKDWVAIHPRAFFDAKKPVRAYLPGIYAVNLSAPTEVSGYVRDPSDAFLTDTLPVYSDFAGNLIASDDPFSEQAYESSITDVQDTPLEVTWEFLIECELGYTAAEWSLTNTTATLPTDSGWRVFCGSEEYNAETTSDNVDEVSSKVISFEANIADTGHFMGQYVLGTTAPIAVTDVATDSVVTDDNRFVWLEGITSIAPIAADDVQPSDVYGLPYIGLQDAGFGGVLHVDPVGTGTFALSDNFSFNKTFGVIWNTYADKIADQIDKTAN